MSQQFEKMIAEIAGRLSKITYQPKLINDAWEVLSPVEELVTAYGKFYGEGADSVPFSKIDTLVLKKGQTVVLEDYHLRLYAQAYRGTTSVDFVSLKLNISGHVTIRVMAQNEDATRVVRDESYESNGQQLILPKLALSELFPGESLYVTAFAHSDAEISQLAWLGARRAGQVNDGLRVVLIRTFGNKNIVQENLERLTNYLRVKGAALPNYLFVVYDATSKDEPFEVADNINCLYIRGGNYGGGGNASLLGAMLSLAARSATSVKIDEIILWDDDAILEPQTFVRHNGFVAFRNATVAHTGVVMAKTAPDTIQEYGALWGTYFDSETTQITLRENANRHMFPYLLRHGRKVSVDWDRAYIGNSQEIDFSTFIYVSVPFELLQQIKGTVPFFLRNDDVELGLRIKNAGASLIVHPGIFAWHEATHNPVSEFFATFHGYVIDAAYFRNDKNWIVKGMMRRLLGASSVKNTALLEAYKHALECFVDGPDWMNGPDVFKRYAQVMGAISSRYKRYNQVPREVMDTLKAKDKVEIISITNPYVKKADAEKEIVFFDSALNKYLTVPHDEKAKEQHLFEDVFKLISKLEVSYDWCVSEWSAFVEKFDFEAYWENYYASNSDPLVIGEVKPRSYGDVSSGEISGAGGGERKAQALIASVLKKGEAKLSAPMPDFNPRAYYRYNPDVEAAGVDAWEHYVSHGKAEGRRYK